MLISRLPRGDRSGQVEPCTCHISLVSWLQVTVQPGMILSDSLFGTAIFQGDNATGFAAGGGGEGAPAAGGCRIDVCENKHVVWSAAPEIQFQDSMGLRNGPAASCRGAAQQG